MSSEIYMEHDKRNLKNVNCNDIINLQVKVLVPYTLTETNPLKSWDERDRVDKTHCQLLLWYLTTTTRN